MKRNSMLRVAVGLIVALVAVTAGGAAQAPQVVTLDTPSPLVQVRVMVRAGSAHDPVGKEGLASVTAQAVLEASFGDAGNPTTKEQLALITQPWGSGAQPSVFVEKEVTTFSMTVPRELLPEYLDRVLRPMFTRPLFAPDEVERITREAHTSVTGNLRYEQLELAGLEALDNYIFDGTSYAHPVAGTAQGLGAITHQDTRRFYATYYQPAHVILGLSSSDRRVVDPIREAISGMGRLDPRPERLTRGALAAPAPVDGRELTIVGLPNAGSTGLHAGFPIEVDRTHPDFWPLYVANVYFGTHRDSHSHLYQRIRSERGYNYGDYSYVEHFAFRPFTLFPPFNTPRSHQYFSIWIRPVGTDYAHHMLKALSWELESFIRDGISDEDVALSKNKAKVLYLNLAETSSRLLAARMDDAFYGMDPGYLDQYLEAIDGVTPEGINAAVRRHLQVDNIKYLIVTEAERAYELAEDIRNDRNARGKTPADYNLPVSEQEGRSVYEVDETSLRTIELDAVWERYWLRLDPDRIRVVTIDALFETGMFVSETAVSNVTGGGRE